MDRDQDILPMEAEKPITYYDLVRRAKEINEELQRLIREEKELTPAIAIDFFRRGLCIRDDFGRLCGNMSGEMLNRMFPNRREEIFLRVQIVDWYCAKQVPTEELGITETEIYVNTLMDRAMGRMDLGCGYYCNQNGEDNCYYVRPLVGSTIEPSPTRKLVEKIGRNDEVTLSEEELQEVLAYEDGIYKLHINIKPEMRKAFLIKLFEEREKTRKIRVQLRQEKGVGAPISNEDVVARGGIMACLGIFKFTGFQVREARDIYGNRVPDFIFYLPRGSGATASMVLLKEGMSILVRDFEDSESEIPRFSAPVVADDGYQHTSLSEVQGDGDFKAYLQRIGRLDEFYDKSANYSRRKK